MEHESDDDTNCHWCSWYSHQETSMITIIKRNCRIGDLGVQEDHRVKVKEDEKRDKYLYLA